MISTKIYCTAGTSYRSSLIDYGKSIDRTVKIIKLATVDRDETTEYSRSESTIETKLWLLVSTPGKGGRVPPISWVILMRKSPPIFRIRTNDGCFIGYNSA